MANLHQFSEPFYRMFNSEVELHSYESCFGEIQTWSTRNPNVDKQPTNIPCLRSDATHERPISDSQKRYIAFLRRSEMVRDSDRIENNPHTNERFSSGPQSWVKAPKTFTHTSYIDSETTSSREKNVFEHCLSNNFVNSNHWRNHIQNACLNAAFIYGRSDSALVSTHDTSDRVFVNPSQPYYKVNCDRSAPVYGPVYKNGELCIILPPLNGDIHANVNMESLYKDRTYLNCYSVNSALNTCVQKEDSSKKVYLDLGLGARYYLPITEQNYNVQPNPPNRFYNDLVAKS